MRTNIEMTSQNGVSNHNANTTNEEISRVFDLLREVANRSNNWLLEDFMSEVCAENRDADVAVWISYKNSLVKFVLPPEHAE
jgi:hypothetical protein